MDEKAKERLAEIAALQNALSAGWIALKVHLDARKRVLLDQLVASNNDETRGRIKELNDLLEMPERLQQEAAGLTAPQQEAELP